MPISLHAAVIPSQLQILEAIGRLIVKAEAACAEHGWTEAEMLETRLAPDMLPFAYQVKSTGVHSLGAIEGVRNGSFSPDRTPPPASFEGLSARIAATIAGLQAIDPAEMESFIGRDMRFAAGDRSMDFTAENFLLSFSQPNFYFHATTVYDILRWRGVQIGKRDFCGRVRKKS